MPIIASKYKAPFLMANRHMQTVFPTLFRKIRDVAYKRVRLKTPDNDFLDLDFSRRGKERVVLVVHGLEGNSSRKYVRGMVRAFNDAGFDAVAMNLRGCSGEANRTLRFYHSGDTEDLAGTVDYLRKLGCYKSCHIVGFSLGGNIVLKYVGESGKKITPFVKSAVTVSTPCDPNGASYELEKWHNYFYRRRFIRMLGEKMSEKERLFPGKVSTKGYDRIRSFRQFDQRYTVPMHGFRNAKDYWKKVNSKQYLKKITIPTLLINALDDPFLDKGSFPFKEARANRNFFLETPRNGGHVGFMTVFGRNYWHESRAVSFVFEHL
jgi:predicted alpha/beta-fold hydrolase